MAADALAQAPDAGRRLLLESGVADLPGWWAQPGRAGWAPELDSRAGFPWALAGLVRGSWRVVEPGRPPADLPYPGVAGTRSPIASVDSVTFGSSMAAWRGFEATLVEARTDSGPARPAVGARSRAQTDFALAGGSSAWEDYALSLRRGDSLRWVRAEAATWKRGAIGALELAGSHIYSVSGAETRGRHRFEGSFGQRGAAGKLNGGEEQSNKGASGHVAWGYRFDRRVVGLTFRRGYSGHESFGPALPYARRDGQETGASAELESDDGARTWGARLEWRKARVVRDSIGVAPHEQDATTVWGALRGAKRLGDGRLELALGAGHQDAVDRFELAPSVTYVFDARAVQGRITLERLLDPVWSDLAAGQAPFLQDTWTAGVGLSAQGATTSAELDWKMGSTRDRAVVARLPLEELWLRSGFRAAGDYDFALLSGRLAWRTEALGAGAEGFVLARDASAAQPRVDPGLGGSGWIEGGGRFFRGDLGVRLRAEGQVIGARESEGTPSRRLDEYLTSSATVIVTLADVLITVRATNLEDRRRAQTWIDSSTGVEALGPGREARFTLTWRLFN